MTSTPTEVAAAAADRFRALRERAVARLARRATDLEELRARNARAARDRMATAKHRDQGEVVSAWPDTSESPRYQFDFNVHDDPEPSPAPPPRAKPPSDPLDDDMSEVETWLR